MRRIMTFIFGMLIFGVPLMIWGSPAVAGDILRFDMMAAVPDLEFAIRNVNGGGSPWVVDVAKGRLSEDGELRITVKGLVLADGGLNPSSTFSGVVSCLADGGATVNTSTAAVPTGPEGNAKIRETLSLPNPCFAPIVFVVGDRGNWFAVTGGGPEAEDEDEVEAPIPPKAPKAPRMGKLPARQPAPM